jgi:hypothetical protein
MLPCLTLGHCRQCGLFAPVNTIAWLTRSSERIPKSLKSGSAVMGQFEASLMRGSE